MSGKILGKALAVVFLISVGLFWGCSQAPVETKTPQKEKETEKTTEDTKEVVFPNGLRFIEMKVGEGKELKSKGRATVHYSGYLSDGTPFDSSYERNKPYEVNLKGGVIQGWIQGLPGMKVGGKRKLIIPPALGYGAVGHSKIPANSTLIFEIKLLQILE